MLIDGKRATAERTLATAAFLAAGYKVERIWEGNRERLL
jgi:hypothetical protein